MAVIMSAAMLPALVVGSRRVKCDNCVDGGKEKINVMEMMRSGMDMMSRRVLQATRYINYDALKKDKPVRPNGKPDQPDNKYKRGCSADTGCFRFTN